MRVNRGQELVIAGVHAVPKNFDALVIGYYEGSKFDVRRPDEEWLSTSVGAELFKKIKPLEIKGMPVLEPA